MPTNCNGTSGLYCSPSANQTLVEDKPYELSYNADFSSLQGQPEVDLYLYDANLASLVTKVTSVPNSGDVMFSVDSSWFSTEATSTPQYIPFQWYVVAAGQIFNVAPSSATYGPVFYAEPLGASSTPSSGSSEPSISVGAIVGIVVSALIIVGACIIGILIFRTKRKPKERVKLDSESDLAPPNDGDEKSIFKGMTVPSGRRGSHTTDATHFDVPLAFGGGAPDTPRSSAVAVETTRMYLGPRPSTAQTRPSTAQTRPSTAKSSDTSKTSLDYGNGSRSFSTAYPPRENVPTSPLFPDGTLSSGWQTGPSQRSQQIPVTGPTGRGAAGQPASYDRPSTMENGGQPQPARPRNDQSAGRPPMDPNGYPRNQPPYPQDGRYQPSSRSTADQQRMPQSSHPVYPQGQQGQAPYPQGQQSQSPYPQVQPVYPQVQQAYPQGQQAARIPQVPVSRPQYDQRPPSRNQQQTPRSPRTAVPPPMEMSQPPSPKKVVDPQPAPRKPVNNQHRVPPVADRGPLVIPTPVPVESQPVVSFSRQNSRRGQIPPFPLDPLTRKPTVTKKTEQTPPVKESEVDIPSDSEETPPPQKPIPIIPTVIPAIKVAEYNRPPSAKSHMAKIEKQGSSSSIVSPPSPTKPTMALSGTAKPVANPMGAGFEGASVPKADKLPTVGVIPTVSTIPPSPSPTATQFTPQKESPNKPAPNTLTPTKPQADYTGSVTADFLRMSLAETEASGRTSMLVEGGSARNSLGASTTFETEGTTPPLVIAKKDAGSPVVKKAVPVAPEKVRAENGTTTEAQGKKPDFEFQLPALEHGSFFNFEDLN